MSHTGELFVYLPSGHEVCPRLLEELYPTWFAEQRKVTELIASSCRVWGFKRDDVRNVRLWCQGLQSMHPRTTRAYWLTVLLVGTARKNGRDPIELVRMFETVGGAYLVLFNKGTVLPAVPEPACV